MQVYKAIKYIRLSYTDDKTTESDSVANQRRLIDDYIARHPEIEVVAEKIDDGYSGVLFDRPAFQEMMRMIEQGEANCVIVKDLSRLGRDYIMTGHYMERYFPEHRVRYISLLDGIDTGVDSSANEITPFRAIMNDMYAKDISKKISSVKRDKQRKGLFIGGKPVYGYQMHPAEKNKIVVDEGAASVVRRIFRLALEGLSCRQIAAQLNAEGIPSPGCYAGLYPSGTGQWSGERISEMLQNETYIGNMVQGKQERISYKVKKRLDKPKNEWVRVENTHPAVIRQSDFDIVQKLLQYDGRASKSLKRANLFSGFLFCGDCKTPMIRRVNQYKGKKKAFYICQTKNKGGDCTRHSIPEEVLKRIVLKEIQAYTALFVDYQMIMEELCEMKVSYDQVIGYDTQISKLQEEYNRYYSLKASLGDDLKEGLISKEEFDDFRESYGRKCEELEQMIENQKKLVKQMFEGGVSATVQLEDWKKSLEIKELDRTLLALTVDKIYIYENKQIKIHIRYQDMIEKMKVIRRFYAEHRTECRKEVR